jgi:O-methyltransferase
VSGPSAGARLYLELIQRCLTRELFLDEEAHEVDLGRYPGDTPALERVLAERDWRLVWMGGDAETRRVGGDWPPTAETMVGAERLANVAACVTDVLRRGVAGDLIEAGVWRGGTAILMRAVLAAYGDTTRRVWVADSFQGIPEPDAARYPADAGLDLFRFPALSVSLERVQANFARYGLLDDQVRFLPGWFRDTLPQAPVQALAVARLDGDLYESTLDALAGLYPKLSVGGYLIVDDYGAIDACRQAVDDYRRSHDIREEMVPVDWTGVYWRRAR